MKIKFTTTKHNATAIENEIQGFLRAGDYSLLIRQHKNEENMVVFEMENRFQGTIENFGRYLKMQESKKNIIFLKGLK